MEVKITGIEEVQKLLRNLSEKELKYATVVGTNRIAYAVMRAQREEVKSTFQGPTKFIQTGIRYEKATFSKPTARAYWTDERNTYIEPHVFGINRATKKIEDVFRGRAIMGRSQWIVPGPGAPLDKFGNPTRAFYRKLYDAADGLARNKKYGSWFSNKKGVFERRGGSIIPLVFFTAAPKYKTQYKFYETGTATANAVAPQIMSETVAKAIARSRG
ncbi:MAG: hypothetical protein IPK63_18760 [Candidatus Competibacteraceae bacterium]|nr:hypothetical protein [Candidatus Competibacteraceae bacterium]